ncbi:MAG: DUF362 domain-containing protein [Kiritimatiellae bacterium]|nr:DUF362 domain-containing protein [Kiritimatiellia bacterium]MDD5523198.1 DUF362 domain-containing protein [Kiritimatiellia bacterium]
MKNHSTVALEHCSNYNARELPHIIGKLFQHLGGIGSFVRKGQSVLIKPNLLTDRTPEQTVTTHPEVVRAIIRILKDHGAKPSVADSPANVVKIEQVWEKTGFRAMCEEENVPLINLEKTGAHSFEVDGFSFSIANPILSADVIINVPKVKTHVLTILTAAVKNMFGAVPGFQKMILHKLHPTVSEFGRLIAVIYQHIPPHLNIADAVVAMDGDGPSAGRPVHLGLLAASRDAVALDLTLCRVLNIDPSVVPYFKHLSVDGNSAAYDVNIEIAGTAIDDFDNRNFHAPGTLRARMIPGWLVKFLEPFIWIAPSISDKCIACGRCIKGCPVNALSSATGADKPVLERRKCIGCCCCHEVCPEKAISMTQSPLLNFVRQGRM